MTDQDVIAAALRALCGPRLHYEAAVESVPHEPGLYALNGDAHAWSDLGLHSAADSGPLYVGTAENSLDGRDVRTHFAAGKTGSSTVRRSLASLLSDQLSLVPVPRDLDKPDGSADFALDEAGEVGLSDWMSKRLALSTWTRPRGVC